MAKIFLMVVAISCLAGCEEVELPVDFYWSPVFKTKVVQLANGKTERVIDLNQSYCTRYRLVDKKKVIFSNGVKTQILNCNGMMGTSADETPKLLNFIRRKLSQYVNSFDECLSANSKDSLI